MEYSRSVAAFLDACTDCVGCVSCTAACPFLQRYGTPDEIITGHPQDAFLCTNCGGCSSKCALGLAPADALFQTKCDLIRTGNIPSMVRQALSKARNFADTGHRFPFIYYSATDTVFWPGCGLAGMYPSIVRKIPEILSKNLGIKVGVVLDCCYDPVYQLGDVNMTKTAIKSIKENLKRHNISRVITGCPNCHKIFSRLLKNITIEHILAVIPQDEFAPILGEKIYLHHPCPALLSGRIRQQTRELLIDRQDQMTVLDSQELLCCGYGGALSSISPALAEQFTYRIIDASGERPIVTYCTGCKHRFIKYRKNSYHILDLLQGFRPLQKPVPSLHRWINRLLLSLSERFKSLVLTSCIWIIFS
ncbi:MAG TPA: (Fe-S)-binding protein [Syntrophales bacterium]|nr:(Fe-S)-binding protein [Syntrophales bacterium]